ncbi:helix-turn-helix transcriptional regulator [Anaeroarcus burkinensis]|uniref:helix-turn-helix transcriptional regulator n=1 Tax=Anaeroarcus burkinensis TaxID=82376 RepID=UPI0003F5DB03|nr:helix-turn-helix transcriptional regulator [Anaeroarcus burkinensis]
MIKLKLERIKQGIKQKDLAKIVGISPQYLAALENNKESNPSKQVMDNLAKALGQSVESLFY